MTGAEMKKFRMSLGLSQTEFGIKLGIPNPQVQISKYEKCNKKITTRLAAALKFWMDNVERETVKIGDVK